MSGADDVLNDMYKRYFKDKYESFEANYVELTGTIYDGPFVYEEKTIDGKHFFEGCIEIYIQPGIHKGPMIPVRIYCFTDEELMKYEKDLDINDMVNIKGTLNLEGEQGSFMYVKADQFKMLKKHTGII